MLISTLKCGKIELILKQSAVYFVLPVVNFKYIFEKIIPLFERYPIKGVKALDYSYFKKVANLMHNKEHLTEQGLSKIRSIKSNIFLLLLLLVLPFLGKTKGQAKARAENFNKVCSYNKLLELPVSRYELK